MSFRNLRSLGVVVALAALTLSYQNCARTNFAIDDGLKEAKLAGTPALGGVVDTGDDVGTPSDVDTGNDQPSTPGTTNPPGTDTPSTPPGTTNPPGTDTPTTPPTTTKSVFLDLELVCPSMLMDATKTMQQAKGELKVVFLTGGFFSSKKACEIPNVRDQIEKNHKIDITACASQLKSAVATGGIVTGGMPSSMYLVESSVTSDFENHRINTSDAYGVGLPMGIAYAMEGDAAHQAKCDIIGDPLLVQLSSKSGQADPINLTSAANGVMFDLLGKRNKYQPVQTAWFADNKSENYFLVLPDSNGDVKGIDQLFGDATFGPDKRYSKQGFQALAKYDTNKDKVISFDDKVFSSLRLWKDENLDGIAQQKELFSLEEKGVVAIDLRYDRKYKERDQYGNMVKYKSIVVMKDNSYGLIFDLWLKYIQK